MTYFFGSLLNPENIRVFYLARSNTNKNQLLMQYTIEIVVDCRATPCFRMVVGSWSVVHLVEEEMTNMTSLQNQCIL